MGKIGSVAPSSNELRHSGEQYQRFLRYLVYGAPGVGKTTLAATMSAHWQGLSKQAEPVHLKDLYWLSCDPGATECLEALNYRVYEECLQDGLMRDPAPGETKVTQKHPLLAYQIMLRQARRAIAGGVTTVVLDTASELNATFLGYIMGDLVERIHQGKPEPDNRQIYGKLGLWESAGYRQLLQLPCNLVILCHIKQHIDYGDSDMGEKKQSAITPFGSYEFQPDLAGKVIRDYYRTMSLGMALHATKEAGRGGKWNRYLTTVSTNEGYIGKSRYVHLLDPEEPANLGALTRKLREENISE